MQTVNTIDTPRLLLRPFRNRDLAPFAELNADPEVMRFMPRPLTKKESDDLVARIQSNLLINHFGLLAAERKDTQAFIGFIGLAIPTFTAHFTPCIEIGWRLARKAWGQGFATEGAKATLTFAFNQLQLNEIVSFTTIDNVKSRQVMERLHMSHNPKENFAHPNLPTTNPLSPHALYRLTRKNWQTTHPHSSPHPLPKKTERGSDGP